MAKKRVAMNIIDLTLPLFDGMPVYPGDPDVHIKQVHTLAQHGWNMATVSFPTHIATHVNVPLHMVENGKTLDDFPLDSFFGEAELYKPGMEFSFERGVIFAQENLTSEIVKQMLVTPPKFFGLSSEFEFDLELEKRTLEREIISFENLANTDQLPRRFIFYGVPLKLREGDGSPVRAFAVLE